jgi:trk system potassium uptake protein TrkA
MNITIVGCGKFGSTLAERLSGEAYDITVIDTDLNKLRRVTDNYDVIGYSGNGTSFKSLEEAGIAHTDVLIAVTGKDEVNLLCCVVAKKGNPKITTIARVRDITYYQERSYLQQSLGISMIINPEMTAANEIARLLRTPNAIDISTFAKGRAELLTFNLEGRNPLIDLPLTRMNAKLGTDILVVAVERSSQAIIPRGNFVFQAGDKVSIAGSPRSTARFFQKIGLSKGQVENVFIVGGGEIGYYLAAQLCETNLSVKILESDAARCEELSELLSDAMVIQGSSVNRDTLMEEGLEDAHAVVSLTNMDEENMMLSIFASTCNPSAKLVTKVRRMPFTEVLKRLNLGSVICPKELTAQHIVQFIRAMQNSRGSNVETLYRILDNKIEALEFRLQAPSAVLDTPLQALPLRDDLLISTIIRSGHTFNPRGTDCLKLGDSVIVVTSHSGLKDITDILRTPERSPLPGMRRGEEAGR